MLFFHTIGQIIFYPTVNVHIQKFCSNLVLGEENVKGAVILHGHFEVKALPHAVLAIFWQLCWLHVLIVSWIEELPQVLSGGRNQ